MNFRGRLIIGIIVFTVSWLLFTNRYTNADWWDRPEVRPTQPSISREDRPVFDRDDRPEHLGRDTETVQPTSAPTLAPAEAGEEEDPCAPGKSYVGPYCGWSPEKDRQDQGGGGSDVEGAVRIGGPEVLGLSATSSDDLAPSDIILLSGVLCLLLFLKSKLRLSQIS